MAESARVVNTRPLCSGLPAKLPILPPPSTSGSVKRADGTVEDLLHPRGQSQPAPPFIGLPTSAWARATRAYSDFANNNWSTVKPWKWLTKLPRGAIDRAAAQALGKKQEADKGANTFRA